MAKTSEVTTEPEITIQPTGKRPPTVLSEYDRIRQKRAFDAFKALKGKIHLDIDIDELRGRNR